MVLSVKEKATKSCQVCVMEMSDHTNHPHELGGNLFTDQAAGGIKVAGT